MDLNQVRKDIDRIDGQMKPLFIERMGCAQRVAAVKAQSGGDVFVLERELAIIEKSLAGVDAAISAEYVGFLRNLFSVSRHYQYGLLPEMQKKVIGSALAEAGLEENTPHSSVTVTFKCFAQPSNLNILCNAIILSNIAIKEMQVATVDGIQQVTMVLAGNLKDAKFRAVLTQIAKESNGFTIKTLA